MRIGHLALILTASVGLAGAASAEPPLSGRAPIAAKSASGDAVEIGRHWYRVTARTTLRWADGRRLQIAELPVPTAGVKPTISPLVFGRFEAIESRQGRELTLLEASYDGE